MPPQASSIVGSILICTSSSSSPAAAALLSSHAWTLRRSISSSSTHRCIMTATASSANDGTRASPRGSSSSNNKRNVGGMFANRFSGWRPSASSSRQFSFVPSRLRSSSNASPVPSFASSSSSQSDEDCSERASSQSKTAKRNFSASANNGSKLSSSRGQAVVGLLPSYLLDARAIVKYSPSTPDGALQLSVAENRLSELPVKGLAGIMEDTAAGGVGSLAGEGSAAARDGMRLVDVLSKLASSNIARPSDDSARAMNVFETDMIYYQPTQGAPGPREAVADYLRKLLGTGARQFDPDNIVLGAGCNAVLENLCMVLADPGDAVMIPTPYYAAFEFDLVARAGCRIVPVNTLDHQPGMAAPSCGECIAAEYYYPTRSSLDAAYRRATEETGRPPRVLLLSHPNNPLGICYPPSVVRECIDWCREREVHLISDEIYAGSVYRKERAEGGGDTFVSAMSLGSCDTSTVGLGLGPYVHLVYALSKDFALSGLRVGVAYTENNEILMPLQKLNDMCQVSSQTQLLVERMMAANAVMMKGSGGQKDTSRNFVDIYLEANGANVRSRCDELQSQLDRLGIPYLPADSGLFVWMDFREFLPALPAGITEATETVESKERRERELYLSLMKEHGLLFTPGMSMRNERPGFFRCVFTAASAEEFGLGLDRLARFAGVMRK